MHKEKQIPIALACDSNYFIPMITTITSLLLNADKETYYHIFILKDSFTDNELKQLNYFEEHYFCKIECRVVDDTTFDFVKKDARLTNPNFFRFSMIDMISEYDKIIWCDTDIIIQEDLTEYFNTPIGDNYLVVSDTLFDVIPKSVEIYKKRREIRNIKGKLFNAGFMTMNLKKMRDDNFKEKLIEWYKTYQLNTTEQVLWNVCDGKVVYIDMKYNLMIMYFHIHFYEEVYLGLRDDVDSVYKNKIKEMLENPVVVHYTHTKPWDVIHSNGRTVSSFTDIWWAYYKKTHIYDPKYYIEYQYRYSTELCNVLKNVNSFWFRFGQKNTRGKITLVLKTALKKTRTKIKNIYHKITS